MNGWPARIPVLRAAGNDSFVEAGQPIMQWKELEVDRVRYDLYLMRLRVPERVVAASAWRAPRAAALDTAK